MAVTATLLARYPGIGGEDQHLVKIAGDTAYPTGGYALTPANFSFTRFAPDGIGTGLPPVLPYWIVGTFDNNTTAEFDAKVNPVNGNLQLFVSSTGAEVANGVDVSAQGVYAVAYGG
jgi:hypothetical protein